MEGDVVSQSQAAYDNTERDLMLLDAYINDPAKQAKIPINNSKFDIRPTIPIKKTTVSKPSRKIAKNAKKAKEIIFPFERRMNGI